MNFKEFDNPGEKNYDLNANVSDKSYISVEPISNPYTEQLIELIGILEDVTDEELQNQYGISIYEYMHPTAETVEKVSRKINGAKR